MRNEDVILIASTSRPIITGIQNRFVEIEARNKVINAQDSAELHKCLNYYHPKYLLIEASFFHDATPEEILVITKRYIRMRVYVFSYHENSDNYLKRLFRAGIEGYLDMRKGKAVLKDGLKDVLTGKMIIPPQFEGMTFDSLECVKSGLTIRDKELVRLIFEGLNNKSIAGIWHIKEQSVKNHRELIYRKLNTAGIIGLIKQILRKGVMSMDEFLAS